MLTRIRLAGNKVVYKNYRIIGSPIVQNIQGEIIFGNNIQMNNRLMDNRIGYNVPCILVTNRGAIHIGDEVGLSQTTIIAINANVFIGNNVKIGGGTRIYTTDFHSSNYISRRNPIIDQKERSCADVYIGDDCFIGAGALILKGVHIGQRTIIGAESVVTKDIPSDCVAAGNPCVPIKFLECAH